MNMRTDSAFAWGLWVVLGLLFALSLGSFLYANYMVGDSAAWQLITSGLILSIPLALLYASIGVIVLAARQKQGRGQLTPRLAKLIYWMPRLAGIAIIFFISLFALDVFEEGYTIGQMLVGFFMHMLPSIALTIVLVLAWRWEWVGFLAFLGAAGIFSTLVTRSPQDGFGLLLIFAGPLLVIALLFGLNWRWHAELHPTSKTVPN